MRNWTRRTISSLFCAEYYTVLRKINKTAATRPALFDSYMHQIVVGWGFAPDPTGELTALPQTPWLYLGAYY